MSPGYVPTGPWTAGSAPGVSAAFLTNLEAFVQQLEGDTGVTTITGGTNGTADCYQPLQGTIKMVVIIEKAFRTGGANQDYTLPVAFTTKGFFIAGDTNTFRFRNGGADQNVDVITALAAGGGTAVNQGNVSAHSFGGITQGFEPSCLRAVSIQERACHR